MTTAKKLTTIAENEPRVYDAGKRDIMAAVQNYGARTTFDYGFKKWHSNGFYPVYDMVLTGNNTQMFYGMVGSVDLAARFEECGVKLDTGKCTGLGYAFMSSDITRVPEIDTRGMSSVADIFNSCSVVTIDNLVLKDDGSQTFKDTFAYTSTIKNLKITGTIGQNGFHLGVATKLTRTSIENIMSHLAQAQFTITLSKTAVNKAFETSSGAKDGSTSAEWAKILADHRDVTVSLI